MLRAGIRQTLEGSDRVPAMSELEAQHRYLLPRLAACVGAIRLPCPSTIKRRVRVGATAGLLGAEAHS
jgi:hypothetical protein